MSAFAVSDNRIYADYAALTPTDPDVLQVMVSYYGPQYGNASSLHAQGRITRHAIEQSRIKIAEIINAKPEEIIFTGSGTEADNMALIGIARAHRASGNHLIISAIEHKAILEAAHVLEKDGFDVTVLSVDSNGSVSIEELIDSITEQTILISVMYVSNEIGTVQPIREISGVIRERRRGIYPLFHTDACQASNLYSLDVAELGVDLMTLNSTKVYGPQGIGLLYKRGDVAIQPLIVGGEQERNLRAGTESAPLVVGFAAALEKAQQLKESEQRRMHELHDHFVQLLQKEIPDVLFNGHPIDRTPAIVHVTVPSIEGESMLLMLDHAGISVSTGSACSAFDLKPSHVLLAIGQNPDLVHGSIRFSFGRATTRESLDTIVMHFAEIVTSLKKISAL